MSIRKIILFVFITLSLSTIANRYSPPAWHWTKFALTQETDLSDKIFDIEYISEKFDSCIANLSSENDKCYYIGTILIILSKIDATVSIKYANKFLELIPDVLEEEFYYVREKAIRALARNGQPTLLIESLDGEDPTEDEIYLMAQAKDYRWYEILLSNLNTTSDFEFCNSTLFVEPFLAEDFKNRQQFIDVLKSTLSSTSSYRAGCSVFLLFNTSLDSGTITDIKNTMATLINSDNSERQQTAVLLTDKWPLSITSDASLISKTINLSTVSSNEYAKAIFTYSLQSMGFISHLFSRPNSENEGLEDLSFSSETTTEKFEHYLLFHADDKFWLKYASELKFTDLQDLFIVSNADLNKFVDKDQKIQYFKNMGIVQSNRLLKSSLADLAFRAKSPLAPQLLNELYASADALQKTALIGRYLDHFSTKPVVRVKTTDPWIKLAEVTNLLTICKIEVPPVGSELSDLTVLAKYLEKAETLLKDCNRINK